MTVNRGALQPNLYICWIDSREKYSAGFSGRWEKSGSGVRYNHELCQLYKKIELSTYVSI